MARIENHYFSHDCWLEPDQLLKGAHRLRGIPGVIVQGRYDVITPPATAFEIASLWPAAELKIVPDAGHATSEAGIMAALVEATDRFRQS